MNEPLVLRTVTRTQGANQALKDGEVKVRGAELRFEEVPVLVQAFRRMVRNLEFDVCEMAVTTYLCAKAAGVAFTAIPVFLVRGLHHGATQVAAGSGVSAPADLEGRRVGVNRGYTVTTGVWGRGILKEHYGVDLQSVTWVRSGDEHVAGYQPPTNVVDLGAGESLQERLVDGDLAAVVGADIEDPRVTSLIPDPERAAIENIKSGGVYPVNHLVVIKDDVLAANPGVASAVFEAFVEAKQPYLRRLESCEADTLSGLDRTNRLVWDATSSDPIPYGVEANRTVLEKLISYAADQKILSRRVDVEEIFDPATLGLSG